MSTGSPSASRGSFAHRPQRRGRGSRRRGKSGKLCAAPHTVTFRAKTRCKSLQSHRLGITFDAASRAANSIASTFPYGGYVMSADLLRRNIFELQPLEIRRLLTTAEIEPGGILHVVGG